MTRPSPVYEAARRLTAFREQHGFDELRAAAQRATGRFILVQIQPAEGGSYETRVVSVPRLDDDRRTNGVKMVGPWQSADDTRAELARMSA